MRETMRKIDEPFEVSMDAKDLEKDLEKERLKQKQKDKDSYYAGQALATYGLSKELLEKIEMLKNDSNSN